jgi:nicotinamide-nucleotide adenylyltransferase
MAKKPKPVGLFIGRFQPFHKGHLSALKYVARRCRKIILAVGSSQCKGEPKNPYSFSERKRMLSLGLKADGLSGKCAILPLTDINDDARWVSHADANLPRYDICFSNNPLVLRLMKKAGKKTARIPFYRRGYYNATKIRQKMRKRQKWEDRVPPGVLKGMGLLNSKRAPTKAWQS